MISTAWWWERLGEDGLVVGTAWWWGRLDDGDGLMMGTAWWWGRLGDEDGLMMRTAWWWERLDDEDGLLMMRTIYLSTLNWADKEFFLIFLYIASLEQAWQNPSNIKPRIELRALISPIRSNINPRVGFELLSETRLYGQARCNQIKRFEICVNLADAKLISYMSCDYIFYSSVSLKTNCLIHQMQNRFIYVKFDFEI